MDFPESDIAGFVAGVLGCRNKPNTKSTLIQTDKNQVDPITTSCQE